LSQVESHLIQIEGEVKSNVVRNQLGKLVSKGHKTYTPTQLVVDRAEGIWLWNLEGQKLMDFASGVLVANLGHQHAYFEERFAFYAKGLPRNAYNLLTAIEVEAASRLIDSFASPKMEQILWAACGSAGIIKAMWAAQRYHPDRHLILATRYGFHGQKGLAGDVTGDKSQNPNVRWIDFPMVKDVRDKPNQTLKVKVLEQLNRLREEYPNQIAMLVTEPYLGAKGSYHPPDWYLRTINDWCNDHQVIFILDEVQSCHGRTGEMYATTKYGLDPDLVVCGKGIGNGEPIVAVVGRADLLSTFDYGEASDTFSGTPRGCAAALATLDTFDTFPILDNCRQAGQVIEKGLCQLTDEFSFATRVRGEGLVWGLELESDSIANQLVLACYQQGLHLIGPLAGNVLRVSPPLIISPTEAEVGIEWMRRALQQI